MGADVRRRLLAPTLFLLAGTAHAQQVPDPVSKTAPAVIADKKTGGITTDGAGLTTQSNSTYTANDIYRMTTTFPVNSYDAIRGVAVATSGTTNEGVMAVAGYAIGLTAQGAPGSGANPVALFGVGVAAANSGWAWGLNTVLTDTTVPGMVSSSTGRQLWNELDFNVTSSNTVVNGLILTGASVVTPTLAVGFQVAPLGTGHPWTAAYTSRDGAAVTGLALGAQGTTASSPGQLLLLNWYTSGGAVANHNFQSSSGVLTMDSTAGPGTGNFALANGNFRTKDGGSSSGLVLGQQNTTGSLSDSQTLDFGFSNSGGVPFNLSLQAKSADGLLHVLTSGAAPTGGIDIPTGARYSIGGVVGVSCSGVPTASHAVVGGITTVC